MNIFRKTSQQNSHFSVSWHSASVSLKKKLRTLDPPPLCLRACPQPLGFFYAFPNQLQPTLPAEKGRKVSLHFCTVTGVYCSLDTYSADKKKPEWFNYNNFVPFHFLHNPRLFFRVRPLCWRPHRILSDIWLSPYTIIRYQRFWFGTPCKHCHRIRLYGNVICICQVID